MHNPESIREFFRKMAESTVVNSNSDRLSVLHNSQTFLPRPTSDNNNYADQIDENFVKGRDFGMGLPPLANV